MDEKLLTPGEPSPTGMPAEAAAAPAPHEMYVYRKPDAAPELPHVLPAMPKYVPPVAPVVQKAPEPTVVQPLPGVPSQKQQQWGVVISIVIIVLMIIVGAFYAWGERIAQNQAFPAPAAVTQ